MPAVSGRDEDSIDVFAIEKFTKVTIDDAVAIAVVLIDERFAGLAAVRLHLGNGKAANIRKLQHGFQIIRATWSDTDHSQCDRLAGRGTAVAAQRARRHDRSRCRRGGTDEK